MRIIISNSSSTPIYEQIKNAIINQIMDGELKEDEALPSIRALAQDIKISVMTIKKAYDELESEGYIVSRQGKGTFVAPKNSELVKEQAQKDIEKYLEKMIDIAKNFNISKDELIELLNIFYGDDENE
ncbi:MAG TPA: GntR family transcriptional regulator [Candidatus Onthocola stercorigallinarum]|jgi:GntR family transcriptional regulator|nr:GntR family transcriptional regulator [Candidatus Onthocola stercorigallinarum]